MSHEPTCPYYRDIRMPGCTCLPLSPTPNSTSILRRSPAILPDAIQSTRLIRRTYIDDSPPEKRVHFHPSQRPRLQLPSAEYDVQDKTRALATRLKPTPCTPRSILRPGPNIDVDIPTIYIITFATDSYPLTHSSVNYLLSTQIPPYSLPVPHLYTLPTHTYPPPPPPLCATLSGISPIIQDIVLSHPPAARAVQSAIARLLDEGRKGVKQCSMSVCCHAGTHRSVAVGERIAQGVKREVGRGGGEVRVVCRHVSRVKGVGDPF